MAPKILIVDDDEKLAKLTAFHLEELGFETFLAHDSDTGIQLAIANKPAIVILDLNLPGIGGLEICKRLRQWIPKIQIVILSCRSTENDKIRGLELGADDYVIKPFGMGELMARVQARLRTAPQDGAELNHAMFRAGELSIDFQRRHVKLGEKLVNLTATEYDLLAFLATNRGRPFSREQLLSSVWGYNSSAYEHTVNTHINRLRQKIESDLANPQYILTVRGVGYRFSEPFDVIGKAA